MVEKTKVIKDILFWLTDVIEVEREEFSGFATCPFAKAERLQNKVYIAKFDSEQESIVDIVKKYIEEHPNVRSFEYSGEPTGKETENRPSKRMNLYDRYLPAIFGTSWSFERNGNKMVIKR